MNQHYFVGISVPSQQAHSIHIASYEMELRKTHKIVVEPEDMHITLIYLGAIASHQMSFVLDTLSSVSKRKRQIEIISPCVQLFGNEEKPRVVYAKINDEPMLQSLQSELAKCATIKGLQLDEKPYIPHITIAKKWRGLGKMHTNVIFKEPISFTVNQFSLFEIHPTQIPKYKSIATFQLGDR